MPRGFSSFRAVAAVLVVVLWGCTEDSSPGLTDPGDPEGMADAYGIWSPGPQDSCTAAEHDEYSVVGPDGLLYPTWHPPVDPVSGCTFGHEHGRDPSGSDLFDEVGRIPFGYASQRLDEAGLPAHRHEDHVGHKMEWENDVPMRVGDGGSAVLEVTCDVLVKMHQGTHSPDAFGNNAHEISYHIRCTDGTGFSATLLSPIGDAGSFVASCDRERVHVVGSDEGTPDGGGRRAIPDADCVREHILTADGERSSFGALRESWELSARLRTADGHTLASFNPYVQVLNPSRYFDATRPMNLARTLEACYGDVLRGRGGPCEDVQPGPGGAPTAWDDPASPFDGTRRFVDVNGNRVRNADGPEIWYTDPLGRNGRTEPFPGSIRQWVARHDSGGLDLHGPAIGRDRDYDAPGVHAPN